MYPDFAVRPFFNKYAARMAREIIHRAFPETFFRKFMLKQKNPFKEAAYALTFDFDFEKDIAAFPVLLDLLKKNNIKAGLAVIGKFVEKYPDIHKRAVEEGHEIINHSYTHPDNPHWAPDRFFNKLAYAEQKTEIEKAHETYHNILGIECIGFRTPHYGNLHTESVYPILAELGYKYSSSTAACGYKGYGAPSLHSHGIIEIPTGCSPNFPLAIFDSWNMLRKKNPFLGDDDLFVNEFNKTIEVISENNLFLTHYFDPYDIIKNKKLDRILKKLTLIKTVQYKDLFIY
ncbi:polysaccharide deacetylase family protein [Maridesulfovibrio hydrothermalis]|uniref:Polysaccharide deacetylase n=1 Tax=Maridesulfovibrio hydrothermalis AM13 = DSM 14728 TaxID=1121451 RepID=L0R8Y8_9BACT|nr:polysaccharide deacetylase family protein [Maridesulfovibrio hydrothermalis]CCO23224.1 Polysaccharide deacetylase [Maridesulfovibrio hydrothermalis AM13 = DSM 14728]